MRDKFKKVATGLFLTTLTTLLLGVGGEWLIRVADKKGLYDDAASQWDFAIKAIIGATTSTPFVMIVIALGAFVAGLWVHSFLSRQKQTPAEDLSLADASDQRASLPSQSSTKLKASTKRLDRSSSRPAVHLVYDEQKNLFVLSKMNLAQASIIDNREMSLSFAGLMQGVSKRVLLKLLYEMNTDPIIEILSGSSSNTTLYDFEKGQGYVAINFEVNTMISALSGSLLEQPGGPHEAFIQL